MIDFILYQGTRSEAYNIASSDEGPILGFHSLVDNRIVSRWTPEGYPAGLELITFVSTFHNNVEVHEMLAAKWLGYSGSMEVKPLEKICVPHNRRFQSALELSASCTFLRPWLLLAKHAHQNARCWHFYPIQDNPTIHIAHQLEIDSTYRRYCLIYHTIYLDLVILDA